jgi:hypothetical protein
LDCYTYPTRALAFRGTDLDIFFIVFGVFGEMNIPWCDVFTKTEWEEQNIPWHVTRVSSQKSCFNDLVLRRFFRHRGSYAGKTDRVTKHLELGKSVTAIAKLGPYIPAATSTSGDVATRQYTLNVYLRHEGLKGES